MSLDMYHMLCKRLEVLPNFLDILSGFGVKTSEVHEEPPISCQRFYCLQDDVTAPQECGEHQNPFKDDLLNVVKRSPTISTTWSNMEDLISKTHGLSGRPPSTRNSLSMMEDQHG